MSVHHCARGETLTINAINGVRSFIVRMGGHGGNWIDRIDKVASTNVIDGLGTRAGVGVRSFIVRSGGHGGNWIDRIDKVASTNNKGHPYIGSLGLGN